MVNLALAGATTGFGRTLLLTMHHLNSFLPPSQRHTLILLSRSPQSSLSSIGIEIRTVDYTSHSSLVSALTGVHTVLSVIGGSPDAIRDAQLAIIDAAEAAGVKRFAPSEYAGQSNEGIDLYAGKEVVLDRLRRSKLEWTRFQCGLFMGAFATGTPKPLTEVGLREGVESGEEEALGGLRPWDFVVNMKAGTADYPGDGTAKMVVTDTRDVAAFVFRAVGLEKWPEVLGMRGDVVSFKEIVEISERVQGRKWLTRENAPEELIKKTEHPGKRFYNQVRYALAQGWGMVGDDLNKAFPDIKTTTTEEFIEKWWSGVELPEASWGEDVAFM